MAQEPTTTYCPACGKAFRVPPDLVGKKILCKSCQTHFVVQADKPGIPAAAPPAAAPARPAAAHHAAPHAPAASHKVPTATAAHPPVTAATAMPLAGPPPVADVLAPIPFDDSPVPFSADAPGAGPVASASKPKELEKVKVLTTGPYYVIKLVTAGKMIHVNIENALNENAAEGWKLEQIITVGGEAYAILSRFNGAVSAPVTPVASDAPH
jgi:hypothetical protein